MFPQELDLPKLARLIAQQIDPDSLLDAVGVGEMLKCSNRRVLEWWVKVPGFPKPISVKGPDGHMNQPRWMRKQITEFLDQQLDGPPKRGRPRSKQ